MVVKKIMDAHFGYIQRAKIINQIRIVRLKKRTKKPTEANTTYTVLGKRKKEKKCMNNN